MPRFHIPLVEPDMHISRIRLSLKTSRFRPRKTVRPLGQADEPKRRVQGRFRIFPGGPPCYLVFGAQPLTQPLAGVSIHCPIGFAVRPTIAPLHTLQCPRTFDCLLPPLHRWPCSFGRQRSKRPSGTPCRTVHKNESWAISSLCRATLPATSEYFPGLLGSQANPSIFVTSCVHFQPRPLPSPGITRLHRYYGPHRHPKPGSPATGLRRWGGNGPAWLSRVAG